MDLNRYKAVAHDPRRTKDELRNMLKNALEEEELEYAAIAYEQLSRRFPGWDKSRTRKGGDVPCSVRFGGRVRHFANTKEAFVWLIDEMRQARPLEWERLMSCEKWRLHGTGRAWIAESPERIYWRSPHLADVSTNFAHLGNGWVVDTNSSNAQKLEILHRVADGLGLELFHDWLFAPRRY